ncbi:uncharacterized protein LOC127836393 [Dreissena polymorpha]|uniref:uncharacterized protein LOC127836393 n=1 Tax=Dreissena polymorpha TaxID=45954 RepID=UPI00226511E4|nr:uncharacterized protein LOC127836393 [Dreissena polymorpha]
MACAIYVLGICMVFVGATSIKKPQISVHVISDYTSQIVCNGHDYHEEHGNENWIISKNSSEGFQSIGKVIKTSKGCYWNGSAAILSGSVQCVCMQGNSFVCNVTDNNIATTAEQWKCAQAFKTTYIVSDIAIASQGRRSTISTTNLISTIAYTKVIHEDKERELETTTVTKMDDTSNIFAATTIPDTTTTIDMLITNTTNRNYNVVAILATAGPFILLDIGIVLFVCRKKLNNCKKRSSYRGNDAAAVSFQCSVNFQNENEAAGFNNVTNAESLAGPNVNINTSCTADGACGYNAHGNIKIPNTLHKEDQLYSHVTNDPHDHACADIDDFYPTISTGKPPYYSTGEDDAPCTTVYDEDPLYTAVRKEKPVKEKSMSNDNDSIYSFVNNDVQPFVRAFKEISHHINSDQSTFASVTATNDPLYSTVNKKGLLEPTDSKKNDPFDPQENPNEEDYIALKTTFPLNTDRQKEEPPYSVVQKKNTRGINNTDWNGTVPPAPFYSTTPVPLYSKVKKKPVIDADNSPAKEHRA